ncbi:MAG: sugar-binding protein [Armatimonadetes bacterium]|nr:sugar-binding protein [Armatimonadota bacterium]
MKHLLAILIAILIAASITSCGKQGTTTKNGQETVKVGFVSNAIADFWLIAKAGTIKAEKDFNAECDYRMPSQSTATEQKTIVEDIMVKGVSGIAISPIDPANQTDLLNDIAAKANLICEDSDAPKSRRICYIGTNNIEAGKAAGRELLKAVPNGGKVMAFVGTLDARNASERYQGVCETVKGSKITILGCLTDNTDRVKAKANAEDTLIKNPDIVALVGLWAYNGPACAEAVKSAGRVGKIKIIAFDEESATLQSIKDGVIDATIAQNPFMIGYESVRVLAALARKEDPKIPESKYIDTGVTVVTKANVDEFWKIVKRNVEIGKK